MSGSDPRQGGDLSDMAVDGTKMPSDPLTQRVIPSVPRPDQAADLSVTEGGLGAPDMAAAATNDTDIPRNPKDIGVTGEVVTGTGDQLPKEIESKNLHYTANNPAAKGHDRYGKHQKHNTSDLDQLASDGAEVEPAPGEENDDQDTIRERKQA